MFSKKFSLVLKELNISNSEISKLAGCNQSTISRFKTGTRIPDKNGKLALDISKSILTISKNSNMQDTINKLLNIDTSLLSDSEIVDAILNWLFKDQQLCSNKNTEINSSSLFSVKLNRILNILNISNNWLSNKLYVDSSYISKFRNGNRTPKSNSKIITDLCIILTDEVLNRDKLDEILDLLDIHKSTSINKITLYEYIFQWLQTEEFKEKNEFENLLKNLDVFSLDMPQPLPVFEDIATENLLNNKSNIYVGINGFRESVIRFLGNTVQSSPCNLYLYSNQNMQWMTEEKSFLLSWFMLMSESIKRGTRIKIIHNINRNISEMISAINAWIPIYMSGMIEPYYFITNQDSHFHHTMFLCEGISCIRSSHIKGFENKAFYYYHTDYDSLILAKEEFNYMLSKCKPLIKIYGEKGLNIFLSDKTYIDTL